MTTTQDPACLRIAKAASVSDAARNDLAKFMAAILGLALRAETTALCNRHPYQRSDDRRLMRAGSYRRSLHTGFGDIILQIPRFYSAQTSVSDHRTRANLLTDIHNDLRRLDEIVLHLAAGHNPWSNIQELLAPLQEIHGPAEWMVRLRSGILALVDNRQVRPLPASLRILTVVPLMLADGRRNGPQVAFWDAESSESQKHATWFTALEKSGCVGWSQVMLRIRERGVLDPQIVTGPLDDGFASAASAQWPRAQIHGIMPSQSIT